MKRYFAILWIALCGEPGFCIVKEAEFEAMHARIARYERRSLAQRKANEARRNANALIRNAVPLAGPQEIAS